MDIHAVYQLAALALRAPIDFVSQGALKSIHSQSSKGVKQKHL
jgi:hypothetical protein